MRHQRQQPKLRLFDEHIFSFRKQIAFRCPQKPFSFQLHYTLSFRKCDGKILFFFCRAYTVWQVIRRWKNTKAHHSRLLQHQNDKLKQFILANVCIPPSYCNNQLNGFFFLCVSCCCKRSKCLHYLHGENCKSKTSDNFSIDNLCKFTTVVAAIACALKILCVCVCVFGHQLPYIAHFIMSDHRRCISQVEAYFDFVHHCHSERFSIFPDPDTFTFT